MQMLFSRLFSLCFIFVVCFGRPVVFLSRAATFVCRFYIACVVAGFASRRRPPPPLQNTHTHTAPRTFRSLLLPTFDRSPSQSPYINYILGFPLCCHSHLRVHSHVPRAWRSDVPKRPERIEKRHAKGSKNEGWPSFKQQRYRRVWE